MNKRAFVKVLEEKLSLPEDKCIIITNIIESNFLNKENSIDELKTNLNIDTNEAIGIYDIATNIIKEEIKNKIKHPFKSND